MCAVLNRYWRRFATVLSYALFGLGCLIVLFLILPIVHIWPGTRHQRKLRMQRVVHYSFRCLWLLMRSLGLFRLSVDGLDRLNAQTGVMVISNHPSFLDVTLLLSLMPKADCIVKNTLWHNPFLRSIVNAVDYIPNSEAETLLDISVERLCEGYSLLIFPEGTRSPPWGLQKFKRGAATIALRSKKPLLPVVIKCTPPTLTKGDKWYSVAPVRPHFSIYVGELIDTQPFIAESRNLLIASRRLTAFLEQQYIGYLGCEISNTKSNN